MFAMHQKIGVLVMATVAAAVGWVLVKRPHPSPLVPASKDTNLGWISPVRARPAPEQTTVSSHESARASKPNAGWASTFHSSANFDDFIRGALDAAVKGDGRAALYISEALSECALVMKQYKNVADSDAKLNQQLAEMTKAPQWVRDQVEAKTRRCLKLANDDPFAQLPPREGGYTSAYWTSQAVIDGDAVAQEGIAQRTLLDVTPSMNADQKNAKIDTAQVGVRAAVESGDPDALFLLGNLFSDGRFTRDPLNGVALSLAACDLGRDCSAKNAENPFSACAASGACLADSDYAFFAQQSLGAQGFSIAYARAQTIKQLLQTGNTNGVLEYLQLDGELLQ
jgi:hypothetical protein